MSAALARVALVLRALPDDPSKWGPTATPAPTPDAEELDRRLWRRDRLLAAHDAAVADVMAPIAAVVTGSPRGVELRSLAGSVEVYDFDRARTLLREAMVHQSPGTDG